MAKFKKKPVIVEAIQLKQTKESFMEAFDFVGDSTVLTIGEDNNNEYIKINTLEGVMKAEINDWIIKGINGEFYPCKPDVFEKTYEPVV